jgi:ABC-type polysaccharide/polyol phosphate export permease
MTDSITREARPARRGLLAEAFGDIGAALRRRALWMALASEDIGEGYRQTVLGPLWLLLNFLLFLGVLIVVMGHNTGVAHFPAYVATGLMVWLFITEVLSEGTTTFTREEAFVKGTVLPLTIYVMRLTARVAIRGSFTLAGAAVVVVATGVPPDWTWLWALPGILVVLLTTPAVAVMLGIAGVVFPDLRFFMANIIRIGFFATPIFWSKPEEGGLRAVLYHWNPFTYFLDVVRAPVVFDTVPVHSWAMVGAMSGAIWVVAILLLGRYRRRLIFLM